MTSRQIVRVVLKCFAGGLAVGSVACANSPTGPSSASSASAWEAVNSHAATSATLAQCLGGSGDAFCFSDARVRQAAATSAAITSAPVLNGNQPVLNSGSTVAFSWTAPALGVATSYVIEASSTPGGPANLANFNTGNPSTTLVVPNVPHGSYYVRVRALDASGSSAPSNEVQLIVGGGAAGGSCPSAPLGLSVVSQSAGTVTLAWMPPLTGAPASYVVQAGSAPNGSNLANVDTNSTALTLVAPNVPTGSYFVRVYARSSSCAPPTFLSSSSNEILMSVGTGGGGGTTSGWSGQIVCQSAISGPGGYTHQETQTWTFGGGGQVSGIRTSYPTQWSAQGSGGAVGKSWTINSTVTTDLTLTIPASGIPLFDRTTGGIIIRGGIVGSPTSFDLYETEFPTIVAASADATSVSGTWSRPTVGGDSPQQPGGSTGALSCSWSLTLR